MHRYKQYSSECGQEAKKRVGRIWYNDNVGKGKGIEKVKAYVKGSITPSPYERPY